MRIIILIAWLLLGGLYQVHSQIPDELNGNVYQNNGSSGYDVNSIPSPEAVSLGNFVHFPPATNNGTNSVSIPLGNIQDGAIQVPITLDYHGSAIRVEEDPSMVGSGWALNAGGVITREVKGLPDDHVERNFKSSNHGFSNFYSLGWLCNYSARIEMPNFPYTHHRWTQFPEIPRLDVIAGYMAPNNSIGFDLNGAVRHYHDGLADLYADMAHIGLDTASTREIAAAKALQNLFTARANIPFPGIPTGVDYGEFSGFDLGYTALTTVVTNDSSNARYSNLDRESDRFIIKAPGLNGTFSFDHAGKPQLIGSNANYEIKYFIKSRNYPNNNNLEYDQADVDNLHWVQWLENELHIYKFEIVNEQGLTYIFDMVETGITRDSTVSYASAVNNQGQSSVSAPQVIDHAEHNLSWFLSKIITPEGREVSFTYTPYEMVSRRERGVEYGPCTNGSCFSFHTTESFTVQTTKSWLIAGIESDHNKVVFTPDPVERIDLPGAFRMETIAFFNKVGSNLIKTKRFHIGTEYLKGGGEHCGGFGGSTGDDDPYCWRLFLKTLCEEGYNDVAVAHKPAYEFDYWDEFSGNIPLPHRRDSKQKDFWGFFNDNGGSNLGNFSDIPTIYVYPNHTGFRRYRVFPLPSGLNANEIELGLAQGASNRMPDDLAVVSGMLKEVKYPTGGSTTYEYEPNEFLDEGVLRKGAGARISKVTNCDGNNEFPCIEKTFKYNQPGSSQTSGQLVRMPNHAYPTAYVKNPNGNIGLAVGNGLYLHSERVAAGIPDSWLWTLFTKRTSSSIFPLTEKAGAHVYYTDVTIDEQGIGRTQNEYHPVRNYLSHSETIEISPNWAHWQFLYRYQAIGWPVTDGNLDPVGLVIPFYGTACPPNSSDLDWGEIDVSGFNEHLPLPLKMDFNLPYGELKSVVVYDENNKPLVAESFEYDTISINRDTIHNLMFGDMHAFCNEQGPSIGFTNRMTQPQAWRKFPIYTGIDWKVTRTSTKNYDQGASNAFVENVEELDYEVSTENPTVFLRSSSTFQSDQGEIKTLFRYPFLDFNPGGSSNQHADAQAIQAMEDLHILGTPIVEEIWQKKSGASNFSLLSAKFSRFLDNGNGLVLPEEVHYLDALNPISSASYTVPTLSNANGFQLDNRFSKEYTATFNGEGNILEVVPEFGTTKSYIYGMDEQLLLAAATNAEVDDIAYTSFEELLQTDAAHNGGWEILGAGGGWNNTLGKTGRTSFDLSPARTLRFAPEHGGNYMLTYWSLNQLTTNLPQTVLEVSAPDADGFRYFEVVVNINAGQNLDVTGANWSNSTDELRCYPETAQMTTSVVDNKLQMVSSIDERNTVTYFDYDLNGRLHLVKDHNRDIVEAHDVNYRQDPCFIEVDFTFNPDPSIVNQVTSFNALTNFAAGSYSVSWDFGDGNFGSGLTPNHTYSTLGTYTVKMSVTHNSLGLFEVQKTIVVGTTPLGAIFSTIASPGGGTYQVTASGGMAPYSYAWEMIDFRNDPSGSIWNFAGTNNPNTILLECGGMIRCTITDSAPGSFRQTVQINLSVNPSPNANPPCQF